MCRLQAGDETEELEDGKESEVRLPTPWPVWPVHFQEEPQGLTGGTEGWVRKDPHGRTALQGTNKRENVLCFDTRAVECVSTRKPRVSPYCL